MAKSKQVESATGVEELTDEQIAALEAENERERVAYEERTRANNERIALAKKARAGKALDDAIAIIEANKANWGGAEIARITKALGAVAGTGQRGRPAGSTNSSDIIKRYIVPEGTFNPVGKMPSLAAQWFHSPEGKAHFEAMAEHRPDFDISPDDNGVPRRGYRLNPEFVAKFGTAYEPAEKPKNTNALIRWLKAEANTPANKPKVNPQHATPTETVAPTPHPTPTASTTPNKK